MAKHEQSDKQYDRQRDTLLSDILTNIQLQCTLVHDQQTEMGNQHPPSAKRASSNALNRRIIESQLELRELIVRFNREFINTPDVLSIPINYSSDSSSPPPSSLRNSIRVVKENKRVSLAISTVITLIIAALLRHYGVSP